MPYKAGPGGQRSPAGTGNPGGGASGGGSGASGGGSGAGGGFGIGGFKADGPGPRSSAGGGVSPRGTPDRSIGGKSWKGIGKRSLTVFEKASMGLPMDDDELAQLTPEQRAAWESQRAAALFAAV